MLHFYQQIKKTSVYDYDTDYAYKELDAIYKIYLFPTSFLFPIHK